MKTRWNSSGYLATILRNEGYEVTECVGDTDHTIANAALSSHHPRIFRYRHCCHISC